MRAGLIITFTLVLSFMLHSCHLKPGEEEAKEYYYTCAMHPQIRENEPGRCPICNMNLTRVHIGEQASLPRADQGTENFWYCKDFPNVISLKEDPCPIDGTPMIKHGESSRDVLATLHLRGSQINHLRLAAKQVSLAIMHQQLRLLGRAIPAEEAEVFLPSRVEGRIERVYVLSTGSAIQFGDPMVDIYSPTLISSGEEYLLARRNYEQSASHQSKILLNQTRERLRAWGIQDFQLERWFRQGRVPRNITLYSTGSGVVTDRRATAGRYVQMGENLFTLSDLTQVWIDIDVFEHQSALVKIGQKVELEFTALPGQILESTIDFISPILDSQTRTLKIRTTITNENNRIKPGMIATATLIIERDEEVIAVPRTAIIDTGLRQIAWIRAGQQSYQAVRVQTGMQTEDLVEILSGLQLGDELVVQGSFVLDAQAQLTGLYLDSEATSPAHIH